MIPCHIKTMINQYTPKYQLRSWIDEKKITTTMGCKPSRPTDRVRVYNEGKFTVRVYLIQLMSTSVTTDELLSKLKEIIVATTDPDNPIKRSINADDGSKFNIQFKTLSPGMSDSMCVLPNAVPNSHIIYKVRINVWGHHPDRVTLN